VGEREWNEAVGGESACSRFRRVNVAVTVRERVENTGPGRRWPKYPPLRRPSRLCAALRPLRGADAALTDASAAGVAGHEEHVCSSVLKENRSATAAGPVLGSCSIGGRMEYDREKVDEMVLALLWLTLAGDGRAWKGHDWDALERLHERGYISDPKSKAKSVAMTEEGERRARELFARHFGGKVE